MDQNQINAGKANRNHLSDLMDDYISDEAIEALLSDDEQAETWFRYQTVSAVLKNEHSAFADYAFTQSISAKIAEESAFPQESSSHSNVIQLESRLSWRRFTGGLAVAASVAFAMVFSIQFAEGPIDSNNLDQPGFVVDAPESMDAPVYELTPADTAEQKKLEEIQQYLDRARRTSFGVNEQYVSGDVRFKSYIVQVKDSEEDKKEDNVKDEKDNPQP